MNPSELAQGIRALFAAAAALSDGEKKDVLRAVVREHWPALPHWSTLEAGAVIEESQKVPVGSAVLPLFVDTDGLRKAVICEAGAHYGGRAGALVAPGGFINLTRTTGSTFVPPSAAPESVFTGAVRELEEELRLPSGAPVLALPPARLKIMDSCTFSTTEGPLAVAGLVVELTGSESVALLAHAAATAGDPAYRAAAAAQTINDETGLPEIAGVRVLPLATLAAGGHELLHADQLSLIRKTHMHYQTMDALLFLTARGAKRPGP